MFARLRRKVSAPILDALKQGLSPHQAALACALGAWIGVLPLLGGTMALCAVVAWRLRLNQVLIQVANYAVYPLQFMLLYPFFKAGVRLFDGPTLGMGPSEFGQRLVHDTLPLMKQLWVAALHATAVWALAGTVVVPLLWWVLRSAFARAQSASAAFD